VDGVAKEWRRKALSRNGLEAIVHCYCGKELEMIKCALLCRKRLAGWLIGMMYCKKGMKVLPTPICSMSEQAGTGSRGRRYLFAEAEAMRQAY
jgi:hypothetical protein